MKKYILNVYNKNWFFLAIILFVGVLPFSQALVSISSGILLFTAVIEDSWKNKIQRFNQHKILLFIPAVYLLYLASAIFSNSFQNSLYDLNKTLFFLVIPIAFLLGKKLTMNQLKSVFYFFAFSIIVSTIVAIINWIITDQFKNFTVHSVSLISHIRFSFQLILAFWFIWFILIKNYKTFTLQNSVIHIVMVLYFVFFLLFQQSLTGLIALISSSFFYLGYVGFQFRGKIRWAFIITLLVLITIPVIYIQRSIQKFYSFRDIDFNKLEKTTSQGNYYWHDFNNIGVENGNYVGLYICDIEMRPAWNKRSEITYDSITSSGYPLSATLIRYLTSRGFKKDAEGVHELSDKDVRNIEKGIANYIFAEKRFSLYPRIYQTIWEYYIYSTTGNANNQSFSQRIEFAKAAISIIKKHPLFGVGTGNWKSEFTKAYQENCSSLNQKYYASSHNQYLNYLVKFGVIGFVFILLFLSIPIIKTKAYNNQFFMVFIVFMFFANFADSNFESHMGSSFFLFFYSFFIVNNSQFLTFNNVIENSNK